MKSLDLGRLVAGTMRIVARLLGESIFIETDLAAGCFVRGDAGMLDQLVMNLALNARDAMALGGTLRISLRLAGVPGSVVAAAGEATGEHVILEVQDTGEGIDPAILPHVFEPFFTTKPEGKGTGMGLATVYGIVLQHSGKITVESHRGVGTTFHVTLPRVASPLDSPPLDPSVGRARQLRILLVEDQPTVRNTVARMLELGGHEVWVASSATEALALGAVHGDRISLLLTDVSLGSGESGPELATEMRIHHPNLPVVYISGLNNVLSNLQLKEGHDFLQKPFQTTDLHALLARRFPET